MQHGRTGSDTTRRQRRRCFKRQRRRERRARTDRFFAIAVAIQQAHRVFRVRLKASQGLSDFFVCKTKRHPRRSGSVRTTLTFRFRCLIQEFIRTRMTFSTRTQNPGNARFSSPNRRTHRHRPRSFRCSRQHGSARKHKATNNHHEHRQNQPTNTQEHNNPSSRDSDNRICPSPGSTTPSQARNLQRQKNMKRRERDARNRADLFGRQNGGTDQRLAGVRPGQRERERERRVSDADASYNGPATSTRTLKHVIPQRNHVNTTLSRKTTRPSPKEPGKRSNRPGRPTQNPILCFAQHHTGTGT